MAYGLSKSTLMSFRQCPRKLWLEKHRPELARDIPGQEAVFALGHEVGELARQLYDTGGGILIEYDDGLKAALQRTREVLSQRSPAPVFEATFERNGLLVRADVLERNRTGTRLVEVKASTSVKPEHVVDCAIQSWVLDGTTAAASAVALAHVDNSFVYPGGGDYSRLLKEQDLSAEVVPLKEQVGAWLRTAKRMLAGPEPAAAIGTRCWTPYECPFQSHCWPPAEHSIAELPGIGRRLDQLLAEGHYELQALPEDLLTTADQRRVWRAARRGTPELSLAARHEFKALGFPRYYLDFETISFAIPRWVGTRPYQQLPFQWSLHVEDAQGGLQHAEFLDVSADLPLRAAAEALLEATGGTGPVFMYTNFERTCLKTLADFCPELRGPLEALAERLVDLLPIARRHYYHPAMHGSWSIKKLLPTIAPELDYSRLGEIQEGGAAQKAYVEAIAPATAAARREEIRSRLLAYCAQDTLAMVILARYLEGRSTRP
jgi:predicted RecB family nuclease